MPHDPARLLPSLSGPALNPAAGGKPREIVVLLHGLGADGHDLISLAPYWARQFPHTLFVAPDAPFPCDMAPYGRQWFSLQLRTPEMMLAGTRMAAPILDEFLDKLLAQYALSADRLALVGFSQGTMMALYVGLRRAAAPAAIVGFSGAIVGAELLKNEVRARPPVLLVHGEADEIVPVAALKHAADALAAAGVKVTTLPRPGLAHAIDEQGLVAATLFLQQAFGGVSQAKPA